MKRTNRKGHDQRREGKGEKIPDSERRVQHSLNQRDEAELLHRHVVRNGGHATGEHILTKTDNMRTG